MSVSIDRKAIIMLSERDLRRAGRLHVFSSMRDPRVMTRLSIIWIGALGASVGFYYLAGMPWRELREYLPPFALFLAVVVFGVAFVLPVALGPIVIRRHFRQNKLIRQTATVSWDEEAYQVEQPGIYSRIPWGDYSKWRENRPLFLFYISDYNYQILPKRVLTQEQIEDIRTVLSAQRKQK